MNGIATIEECCWGDCQGKGAKSGCAAPQKTVKPEGYPDGGDTCEHRRETKGKEISPKKGEGDKKSVKVEGAMVVLRIVSVKSDGSHLVNEPTIDPFVKVGRFEVYRPESQECCEE